MSQCRSMVRFVMHREGVTVYLRCKKRDNHVGLWHESWIKKWKDKDEDGWFEDEYDDLPLDEHIRNGL